MHVHLKVWCVIWKIWWAQESYIPNGSKLRPRWHFDNSYMYEVEPFVLSQIVFLQNGSGKFQKYIVFLCINIWAAWWENQRFAYAKTKTQISFAVTPISTIPILPSYKIQASCHSSGYTAWFVLNLVRIHFVGFLTLRLICNTWR